MISIVNFGWASARMDDVVNWIPSRLTGFIMLLGESTAKNKKAKTWNILFRDAKKHPSPNSGWCETLCSYPGCSTRWCKYI